MSYTDTSLAQHCVNIIIIIIIIIIMSGGIFQLYTEENSRWLSGFLIKCLIVFLTKDKQYVHIWNVKAKHEFKW